MTTNDNMMCRAGLVQCSENSQTTNTECRGELRCIHSWCRVESRSGSAAAGKRRLLATLHRLSICILGLDHVCAAWVRHCGHGCGVVLAVTVLHGCDGQTGLGWCIVVYNAIGDAIGGRIQVLRLVKSLFFVQHVSNTLGWRKTLWMVRESWVEIRIEQLRNKRATCSCRIP
jgi:hypothetical protein